MPHQLNSALISLLRVIKDFFGAESAFEPHLKMFLGGIFLIRPGN
jgi:hypothetical protein